MMKFIKKNKKGFTLVELIVVIAILGILAALVVPRFGEFQNQANISHDRATLRTVQGAVNMYRAQNGRWPDQAVGAGTTTTANYTALANDLATFLELQGGATPVMPIARSIEGATLRVFQYNPADGVVSILPALPAVN